MKEFIKRFAPFFLTFALGMFLASLFLPVSTSRSNYNRGWKYREHKRTKCENYRMKKQLEELRRENLELKENVDFLNVPPPPIPPAPPKTR